MNLDLYFLYFVSRTGLSSSQTDFRIAWRNSLDRNFTKMSCHKTMHQIEVAVDVKIQTECTKVKLSVNLKMYQTQPHSLQNFGSVFMD